MQKNPSVSFKQSLEDIDKDEGDRLQASMSTKTKHKSLFAELAIFSSMSSLPPQSQIAQTSRPTLSVYTTSNGQSQKGQGWFSRMSGFHSLSRTNSLSGNNSRESTLSRSIPTVAMSPINLISAETPKWYVLTEKELEDYIDAQDDNNVCLAKPGIALDVSTMTKQEVRRQEVIYELIQTERDYVKDMKLLIDLFLRQFRQKHILSQREVTKIFSNVEQLTSVNKELLRSLEKRRIEEKCAINKVGDIFLVVAQFFRMYNIYCANYPEAQAFLLSQADNVDLKLFLQYCYLKPECRSLDLDSYLLKPVQRICKYPLLLKEILKYTDTTHPDHADLTAACNLISKVVDTVNESRRFVENQQKLLSAFSKLDFDPTTLPTNLQRRFLMETIVYKVNSSNHKTYRRLAVLLSDHLLIGKQNLLRNKYQVRQVIPLLYIEVEDVSDTGDVKNAFMLKIDTNPNAQDPSKKVVDEVILTIESSRQKATFFKYLQVAVESAKNAHLSAKNREKLADALLNQRSEPDVTDQLKKVRQYADVDAAEAYKSRSRSPFGGNGTPNSSTLRRQFAASEHSLLAGDKDENRKSMTIPKNARLARVPRNPNSANTMRRSATSDSLFDKFKSLMRTPSTKKQPSGLSSGILPSSNSDYDLSNHRNNQKNPNVLHSAFISSNNPFGLSQSFGMLPNGTSYGRSADDMLRPQRATTLLISREEADAFLLLSSLESVLSSPNDEDFHGSADQTSEFKRVNSFAQKALAGLGVAQASKVLNTSNASTSLNESTGVSVPIRSSRATSLSPLSVSQNRMLEALNATAVVRNIDVVGVSSVTVSSDPIVAVVESTDDISVGQLADIVQKDDNRSVDQSAIEVPNRPAAVSTSTVVVPTETIANPQTVDVEIEKSVTTVAHDTVAVTENAGEVVVSTVDVINGASTVAEVPLTNDHGPADKGTETGAEVIASKIKAFERADDSSEQLAEVIPQQTDEVVEKSAANVAVSVVAVVENAFAFTEALTAEVQIEEVETVVKTVGEEAPTLTVSMAEISNPPRLSAVAGERPVQVKPASVPMASTESVGPSQMSQHANTESNKDSVQTDRTEFSTVDPATINGTAADASVQVAPTSFAMTIRDFGTLEPTKKVDVVISEPVKVEVDDTSRTSTESTTIEDPRKTEVVIEPARVEPFTVPPTKAESNAVEVSQKTEVAVVESVHVESSSIPMKKTESTALEVPETAETVVVESVHVESSSVPPTKMESNAVEVSQKTEVIVKEKSVKVESTIAPLVRAESNSNEVKSTSFGDPKVSKQSSEEAVESVSSVLPKEERVGSVHELRKRFEKIEGLTGSNTRKPVNEAKPAYNSNPKLVSTDSASKIGAIEMPSLIKPSIIKQIRSKNFFEELEKFRESSSNDGAKFSYKLKYSNLSDEDLPSLAKPSSNPSLATVDGNSNTSETSKASQVTSALPSVKVSSLIKNFDDKKIDIAVSTKSTKSTDPSGSVLQNSVVAATPTAEATSLSVTNNSIKLDPKKLITVHAELHAKSGSPKLSPLTKIQGKFTGSAENLAAIAATLPKQAMLNKSIVSSGRASSIPNLNESSTSDQVNATHGSQSPQLSRPASPNSSVLKRGISYTSDLNEILSQKQLLRSASQRSVTRSGSSSSVTNLSKGTRSGETGLEN